jgi:hypothetical protein
MSGFFGGWNIHEASMIIEIVYHRAKKKIPLASPHHDEDS